MQVVHHLVLAGLAIYPFLPVKYSDPGLVYMTHKLGGGVCVCVSIHMVLFFSVMHII